MNKLFITTDFILLHQALKLKGIISTGGEAKIFLEENDVFVNEEKENRRGRKLYDGDKVRINKYEFVITHENK